MGEMIMDFIENLGEQNGAAGIEVTEASKHPPNFRFVQGGKITDKCLSHGLTDFYTALNYVWKLPYGRNSDRADYNLVLKEECGTCSTKHALLAQLADEQNQPIFLTLGIYEMSAANTTGVRRVLAESGVENLPEAHCYLAYAGRRFDVTRFLNELPNTIENFLYEERISPDQIGDYKLALHRKFFQDWMRGKNLDKKFRFEELWNLREKCIAGLAQTT